MLKPIHHVSCSPALRACQNLQRRLVDWVCDVAVGAADINKANLIPPRVPSQIEADWLWEFLQKVDDGESLLARTETLAAMPAADKGLLQVWVNAVGDLASQFQPHPPAWPVARPYISKQAWAAFKKLMEAFYEKGLRSGLPYADDGTPIAKGGVDYAHFVKMFRETHRLNNNPNAREVCVLCGGELETPEVDHWVNKGAYPLLSVCEDNLLPACGRCNSTSNKGAKPVHSQGSFADWFHPYLRHPKGGIVLKYDSRTLSITAMANNPMNAAKVANLDQLLNLTTRWTREFKAEYARQQGVLIGREQKLKLRNQPGQSQADILAHIQTVQDDLLPSEPHHEVHSVLLSALLNQARLTAWQTELGLV